MRRICLTVFNNGVSVRRIQAHMSECSVSYIHLCRHLLDSVLEWVLVLDKYTNILVGIKNTAGFVNRMQEYTKITWLLQHSKELK